jgi:predicted nucleotidyltransferase
MKNFEQIINEFIEQMKYKQNEHFLGVYFYGSCLSGFNNDNSDIDLHIVFDNTDKYHIFRGIHYLNGNKIEYFEK